MGMYDTIQQAPTPMGGISNGTSAQKSNAGSQHMRGRGMSPATSGQKNVQAGVSSGFSSPAKPGMMGSRDQIMAKQKAIQNQATGVTSGSYDQMLSANPQLADYRNTGMKSGMNMSWMDKPGALTMGQPINKPAVIRPQYGLPTLQTPADIPPPVAMSPMQAANQQMQGYDGPDLGSQDPRELARVSPLSGVSSLYGTTPFGGTTMNAGPGEQDLMQTMGHGIGPSAQLFGGQPMNQQVQMDENGLEPRRGAR
jgi:hypothetical protein